MLVPAYICSFYIALFLRLAAVLPGGQSASSHSVNGRHGGWWDAPWQPQEDARSLLERLDYGKQPPTVFSPTGRLYPVENIMEAIQRQPLRGATLAVAISCRDGILLLSTLPASSSPNWYYRNTTSNTASPDTNNRTQSLFLDDRRQDSFQEQTDCTTDIAESFPYFHCMSRNVIALTVGNPLHGQILKFKLQDIAEQMDSYFCMDESETDTHFTASTMQNFLPQLARALADHFQVPTQQMGSKEGPLLASVALLIGNNQIWRIDPTGQFYNTHAAIVGKDSDKIEEALYTRLFQACRQTRERRHITITDPSHGDAEEDLHSQMGTFLETVMDSDDCLDQIVQCVQDSWWPMQKLSSTKSYQDTVPWVATTLLRGTSFRRYRRRWGTFVPPLPQETQTSNPPPSHQSSQSPQ